MHDLLRLSGRMAAHAVWSVSDLEEGALIPILATDPDAPKMQRLVAPMDTAREAFREAAPTGAVFIYDGFVTLDGLGRSDCLFVEIEIGEKRRQRILLGVPYQPYVHKDGFAVFRPKVLELAGVDQDDLGPLMEHFWEGVDSHEQGVAVWNAALDQSK